MNVIATDSLTLEPQVAAHAEAMFGVLSDPAIYTYENEPPPSLAWLRDRFARLESRCSPDGQEQWLNWVIRLPTSELAGYVQATVHGNGSAAIAYELASAYWGRGLARQAVQAMIGELVSHHRVRRLSAVLKRENARSLRLLERLGFAPATPEQHIEHPVDPDELLMQREIMSAAESDLAALLRALQPVRNGGTYVYASLPPGADVAACAAVAAIREKRGLDRGRGRSPGAAGRTAGAVPLRVDHARGALGSSGHRPHRGRRRRAEPGRHRLQRHRRRASRSPLRPRRIHRPGHDRVAGVAAERCLLAPTAMRERLAGWASVCPQADARIGAWS